MTATSRHPALRPAAALLLLAGLLLAGCSTDRTTAPSKYSRAVGKPYQVKGVWYRPREDPGYDKVGIASWYGPGFHGKRTASGQRYDMNALSAAHKTLPFGTRVKVTNLENRRSTELTINDRGPFVHGRIIDVSRRAAGRLDFRGKGVARVRVEVVGAARQPAAAARQPPIKATQAAKPAPTAAPVRPAEPKQTGHFQNALNSALESGAVGSATPWRDPGSGRHGMITPLTAPRNQTGPRCRNYRRTSVGGEARSVYVGRACLDARGLWLVERETLS